MAGLNFGDDLFGDKQSIEGISPDTHEISREGDLNQSIDLALARSSLTLVHLQTNNLFNINDGDSSTFMKWSADSALSTASITTTLILDAGKKIRPFNTQFGFRLINTGTGVGNIITSHSENGTDWTEIANTNLTSASTLYFDHALVGNTRYRYLRIVYISQAPTTSNCECTIFNIRVVR